MVDWYLMLCFLCLRLTSLEYANGYTKQGREVAGSHTSREIDNAACRKKSSALPVSQKTSLFVRHKKHRISRAAENSAFRALKDTERFARHGKERASLDI